MKAYKICIGDTEYSSYSDALLKNGISNCAVMKRRKAGMTIEEAILDAVRTKELLSAESAKKCLGFNGVQYRNEAELCTALNISLFSYQTLLGRYKDKTPQEIQRHLCEDGRSDIGKRTGLNGEIYNTQRELAEAYGIDVSSFLSANSRNENSVDAIKQCLKIHDCKEEKITRDHLGNQFQNDNQKAEHYGLSLATYRKRISNGWSEKTALETKTGSRRPSWDVPEEEKKYIYHGKRYNTLADLANDLSIPACMLSQKRGNGPKRAPGECTITDEFVDSIRNYLKDPKKSYQAGSVITSACGYKYTVLV